MDEPAASLDPIATAVIEELIDELRASYTIVVVTHSMQQAARISQRTAFFHLGRLIEHGLDGGHLLEPAREADRGLHHRQDRLGGALISSPRPHCAPRNDIARLIRCGIGKARWEARARHREPKRRHRPATPAIGALLIVAEGYRKHHGRSSLRFLARWPDRKVMGAASSHRRHTSAIRENGRGDPRLPPNVADGNPRDEWSFGRSRAVAQSAEPVRRGSRTPAGLSGGGPPARARLRHGPAGTQSPPSVTGGCRARLDRHDRVRGLPLAGRSCLPPPRRCRGGADRLRLGGRGALLPRARQAPQCEARRRLHDDPATSGRARRHDRPDPRPPRHAPLARARQHRPGVHRRCGAGGPRLAHRGLRMAQRRRPPRLRSGPGDGRNAATGARRRRRGSRAAGHLPLRL